MTFTVDQVACIAQVLFRDRNYSKLYCLFTEHSYLNEQLATYDDHRFDFVFAVKAIAAYEMGDYIAAVHVLMKHSFGEAYQDVLLEIWFKTHYMLEGKRKRRELKAMDRYRVRKRNPPPPTLGRWPRPPCAARSFQRPHFGHALPTHQ